MTASGSPIAAAAVYLLGLCNGLGKRYALADYIDENDSPFDGPFLASGGPQTPRAAASDSPALCSICAFLLYRLISNASGSAACKRPRSLIE